MPKPSWSAFCARSLNDAENFWLGEAERLRWHRQPSVACDQSNLPFASWFPDGQINLCENAVDRWAESQPEALALIAISTETGAERTYSFSELKSEVERWAALYQARGLAAGDRVMIYMPMVAEAIFAMLAAVRIGAIHAVVFGGFTSRALSSRIDDAKPKIIVSADGGMRGGKVIAYKPLLEGALETAQWQPEHVLLLDRGLAPITLGERQERVNDLLPQFEGARVPPVPVPSSHPSYVLYTSGTTGTPKGVQRDTGGYAVALASTMEHLFFGQPGSAMFTTSDIGWVVGHSYIVYGPLIAGMATICYEGLPVRPDAGVWWRIAERFKVRVMFTAPTALRVLKKEDPAHLRASDLSALKALFVAGEPLDEPTSTWIEGELGVPIIDNYWQTETGWPILAVAKAYDESLPLKSGSPGMPMFGYDIRLVDDETGKDVGAGEKGVLAINAPLPPGCLSTVWGDPERFVTTYFQAVPGRSVYSTFDWATKDEDGYYTILGRTDDVINVAGHRLGTREIEEAICRHAAVAEAAVIGATDPVKTQVPIAFVVLKKADADPKIDNEICEAVVSSIGAIARPGLVHIVPSLPKTRSGKILRRTLQAIAEGRETGDVSTIEDAGVLETIRAIADKQTA